VISRNDVYYDYGLADEEIVTKFEVATTVITCLYRKEITTIFAERQLPKNEDYTFDDAINIVAERQQRLLLGILPKRNSD